MTLTGRTRRNLALLVALLVGGLAPSAPARAQDSAPARAQDSAPAAMVSVLVELTAPSAAEAWLARYAQSTAQPGDVAAAQAEATAAAQAQLALVEADQAALSASLDDLGATTLYRAQRVYNAIGLLLPGDRVQALASLPGVRSVKPLLAKQLDNSVSVRFLGAPLLWDGAAGTSLTGAGVTIGIIDTGIDYLHTDFGGAGEGYHLNDVTRIDDISAFPGAKVVGGWDFVGDSYDASPFPGQAVSAPRPDPDPMDCNGHGTHVAGTAAGYGVLSSGATFGGPWDSALPFSALRIGPGVAPLASLYALKVFGCTGSSLVVDAAIEWAVDPNGDGDFGDHLDIINMSLGSPFGDREDSTSVAADKAAQLGVIVVTSAGNNGDVYYAAGSPGSANYAISVAATTAETALGPAASRVSDTLAGFSSRGPRLDNTLKPDVAAPGVQITSAQAGSGNGARTLSGTSMAAPHVSGAMALLRQLHPDWRVEELKALVMNTAMPAVRSDAPLTSTLALPVFTGAGRIDLSEAAAADSIAFNADERGVVNLSWGAPEVLGSYAALRNLRVTNRGATAQQYSVRYVAASDMPGVTIAAPATLSVPARGFAVLPVRFEATAAQMRNVPPARVDATASQRVWQSEESGILWLWPSPAHFSATASSVAGASAQFTYDVDSRRLSFSLPVPAPATGTLQSYTLRSSPPDAVQATAAYTLYTRIGNIAPGSPIVGSVILAAGDAPLLAGGDFSLRAEGSGSLAAGVESAVLAETPVLKVPVYGAPRPVTQMLAASPAIDFGSQIASLKRLDLAGATLAFSATPTTTRPLVSMLELQARSPRAPTFPSAPTPGYADVKYVGVGSDYLAVANKEDARIFFGIATWAPWSTPNQVRFTISVDTNGDKFTDYFVYNSSRSALSIFPARSDALISVVESSSSSTRVRGDPLNILNPDLVQTAILNSDVLLLSVPAAALGLTGANPAFSFRVDTVPLLADDPVTGDAVDWMRYNMARPGLNLTNGQAGSPLFIDAPSTKLDVGFDLAAYGTSSAKGILLLHHHNLAEVRAESIDVKYQWPTRLFFPFGAR